MRSREHVFISYRRADSALATGRIYDRLVARFGARVIFKDVESIPVAADFHVHIDAMIKQSVAMLVVIGRDWASITDADHRRRLWDPRDLVRVEVETAFRHGIPVVPLLVDSAKMPDAVELPESLTPLTRLNGLQVRADPDFDADIQRVIAALQRIDPRLAAPPTSSTATTDAVGGEVFSHQTPKSGILGRSLYRALPPWWLLMALMAVLAILTAGQAMLTAGWSGLRLDTLKQTTIGRLIEIYPVESLAVVITLLALTCARLLMSRQHRERRRAASRSGPDSGDTQRLAREIQQQTDLVVSEALPRLVSSQFQALRDMLPPPPQPPFDLDKLLAPPHLVDRLQAKMWLLDQLRLTGEGATFAVEGMGGVGKSSLVSVVLQDVKRHGQFPDGIVVMLCGGRLDALAILRDVLRRFTRNREALDTLTPQELSDKVYQELLGKRVLVVLDSVEPGLLLGDITLPLQLAGAIVLVVASFRLPAELRRAALQVDLLGEADALELFRERYGSAMTRDDEQAAQRIVDEIVRHSLAIVLAAEYASDTHLPLVRLANELADARSALELDEHMQIRSDLPPRGLRATFQRSFSALPPESRQMFSVLGVMPTADFEREAVVAVASATGVTGAGAALDMLIRRSLVDQYGVPEAGARLRQHALLRAFAREQMEEAYREVAERAMSEYYASVCVAHANEYAILDREYDNIIGGLIWAHDQAVVISAADPRQDALNRLVTHYLSVLHDFLGARGHWRDRARFVPWGIEAAERTGQEELRATLLVTQSKNAYGDNDTAERYITQALEIARAHGFRAVEAYALERLGALAHYRMQLDESIRLREQARQLLAQLGNRKEEAECLVDIGHVLSDQQEYDRAIAVLNEGLNLARRSGNRNAEAYATLMLGKTSRRQGQLESAMKLDLEALRLYTEVRELGSVGGALEEIGLVEEALGHDAEASARWEEAVEIYRALGVEHRVNYVAQNLIGRRFAERWDS